MDMARPVLLLDTSCAIALIEELERPDLLEALVSAGFKIEIPQDVVDELKSDETARTLDEMAGVSFLGPAEASISWELENRYPILGAGEIGVLARASKLEEAGRDYRCVLDDGWARKVATRLGKQLTGTIGLLDILVEKQVLSMDERNQIVEDLRAQGFRYTRI
jgi:predicted nucleic acid-binding protein